MIKNIVFDIGNVLMEFSWMRYIKELYGEELSTRVSRAIWNDNRWNQFDEGIREPEDIMQDMYDADPEVADQIKAALDGLAGCMDSCDYAIPWIQELKAAGKKVYYLSNYSEFVMDKKREVLSFLPYTDGGIFSCYVKCIKPDPKIYQILLDTYGLKAEECLFLDDKQENVDGAIACGLHSLRFTGYEEMHEKVAEYIRSQENT